MQINEENNAVLGQPQSGVWFGKSDDLWRWVRPRHSRVAHGAMQSCLLARRLISLYSRISDERCCTW